jgi:hypothetical protein
MSSIDPISIVTFGIITTNPDAVVFDGIGYFVVVEEIPPTPPVPVIEGGGGGIFDQTYELPTKKYTLRVSFDGEIADYVKTIEVKDLNVYISNVSLNKVDGVITVLLRNINTNEVVRELKVSIY